jgi:hypothetical protein
MRQAMMFSKRGTSAGTSFPLPASFTGPAVSGTAVMTRLVAA